MNVTRAELDEIINRMVDRLEKTLHEHGEDIRAVRDHVAKQNGRIGKLEMIMTGGAAVAVVVLARVMEIWPW